MSICDGDASKLPIQIPIQMTVDCGLKRWKVFHCFSNEQTAPWTSAKPDYWQESADSIASDFMASDLSCWSRCQIVYRLRQFKVVSVWYPEFDWREDAW